MNELLKVSVENPRTFLLLVVLGSVIVRLVVSAFDAWHRGKGFVPIILGVGITEENKLVAADRLTRLFLGILELLAYPVLMKAGVPEYIGAWLAFKTVNRWQYRKQDRGLFNRYLLGNALILLFSYCLARFIV